MPKYKITVERDYVVRERADLQIEADTPQAALDQAREYESDQKLDGEWCEVDGGADTDSYEWRVGDETGKVVLIAKGTADD